MDRIRAERLLYINDDFYNSAEDLDMFDEKKCFDMSDCKTLSECKNSKVQLITIDQSQKRYILKYGRSGFYRTGQIDKWLLYYIKLAILPDAMQNNDYKSTLYNLFFKYNFGSIERDIIMSLFVSVLDIPRTPRIDFIFSNTVWSLGMCMQYSHSEDLFTVMHKMDMKKTHISFHQKIKWANDIFTTVYHLHKHNIAHMDIALENVIIDNKTKEATLIDYGFAMFVNPDDPRVFLETAVGREHYISFEILKLMAVNPLKADIYALGVLLFSLFFHVHPYELKYVQTILEPNFQFYDFIEKRKEQLKDRMKYYAGLRHFFDYPVEFFDQIADLLCEHMIQFQSCISSWSDILNHPLFQNVSKLTTVHTKTVKE